ncbi:MAG: branched-chain amino acid transporter permease [Rhodoferax sp.]|nr:branched-chain amino acid transporter permease [Rhodoferax sp.]
MNLDLALSTAVAGIVSGAYYSLLGLAIALIYRSTAVANFAQGELGTFSTFLLVLYVSRLPMSPVLQLLLSIGIAAGISGIAYRVLLRAQRGGDSLNLTVRTLALYTLVHAVTLYFWGANEPYTAKSLFSEGGYDVAGFQLAYDQLGTLVIAGALGLGLFVLFRFTRVGLAMRSVAMNAEVASLLGIDVNRIALVVWLIAGAIGALVAMLIAPVSFLGTDLMQPYILKAFTAAVLGGLTSFPGVVLGGLLLGLIESFGSTWISIHLREPFTFAILLLVLLFRPAGLFGRQHLGRV